ncbi:hypothetical protein BJV82DRAFT_628216 [Fennellomyces sp. T-0311]|nr:hypothetical protein BJV82DRAFT_628216 [Fennellomyces sp. T-0311]
MSLLNNVENVLQQLHTAKTQLENMRREIQSAPAAESSTSQTPTIGTIQPTTEQTRRIKEAFSCTICVDYFDSPYTLQCGHTFCKDCIMTWFGRQKSCPGCRRDIIQRPVPAFTVEIQVNAIRSLIPSLGAVVRQTNQEQEQTVRQFERLLDDMFPARANVSFIRDDEDGVDRCPNCAWELDDDGMCLQCNIHFREAARPRDSSDSSESSDEEEDSDLNSFITSDGHVSVMQSDSSDDDSSDDDSDIVMGHR